MAPNRIRFYRLHSLVEGTLLGRETNDLGELAYRIERNGVTHLVRPSDVVFTMRASA